MSYIIISDYLWELKDSSDPNTREYKKIGLIDAIVYRSIEYGKITPLAPPKPKPTDHITNMFNRKAKFYDRTSFAVALDTLTLFTRLEKHHRYLVDSPSLVIYCNNATLTQLRNNLPTIINGPGVYSIEELD